MGGGGVSNLISHNDVILEKIVWRCPLTAHKNGQLRACIITNCSVLDNEYHNTL